MIDKKFMTKGSFYIYHLTGEKVYPEKRDKKLHYVFDKGITFYEFDPPKEIFQRKKNLGKSSDDLDRYYLPLNDISDEGMYFLIRQIFKKDLDLG